MVCYNGRILYNWEIDEASPNYRVQMDLIRGVGSSSGNSNENVADESDGDEIREADVGGEDFAPREVAHDEAGVLAEMRRLFNRQERLAVTQDREGSSVEAQRYLVHSDSDLEGEEHQTILETPMRTEDYVFHNPSSGDGDGGMGLFSGTHDGV
ncbi:hypothetical protein LIER_28054 [Lithospermum erythrorhizon]|uniref:Uncharacterized protein n=1 Tax=Lithospermum erythrorhizon TaxID=34254 RepID=A0AAV3RH78_LITER